MRNALIGNLSSFIIQDEDGSMSAASAAAAAAKQANPSSLLTSEGLKASYQDLDKIFDNSDESNDTVTYSNLYFNKNKIEADFFSDSFPLSVPCTHSARLQQTGRSSRRYGPYNESTTCGSSSSVSRRNDADGRRRQHSRLSRAVQDVSHASFSRAPDAVALRTNGWLGGRKR